MNCTVFSAPADQGGPLAYAKEFLLNRNLFLESLTWVNKSAATVYIQLFDSPRKMAVPITNTVNATGIITAAAHSFVTGDHVFQVGIDGMPGASLYVNVVDADTFTFHLSRALALSGASILPPDADGDTGVVDLYSNIITPPVCEEYPVLAETSAPSNVGSYTNGRFRRGLYVRAVTAINGSTLISAADIKFTPRYRFGPIAGPVTYAD